MTNTTLFQIKSGSPRQTQEIGVAIGKIVRSGDVVLLLGNLGAGKTCLTQGIARGMNIKEYTSSPSFVMIKEYQERIPLYHIDLYRIDNLAEINNLGMDDYLYGKGVCVIEWADRALELLSEENMTIRMNYLTKTSRSLQFLPVGKRYIEMQQILQSLFPEKKR
jgi:tRNA threonylcarbamoyladenosine biosynthesis protein TsaE